MATSVIDLQASPEAVYALVADLTRHGEFAGHELSLEHVAGPPAAAGGRYRSRGRQFGQELQDELIIVQAEAPRRFVFDARGRGGVFRHAYLIEARDGGTRLVRSMTPRSPFLLRLIWPLAAPFVARRNSGDLQRLRRILEG